MKIELDVSADEAKDIVDYLAQNKEVNKTAEVLYRIIETLYTKMCKQETENESFREAIESFLVFTDYPSSPDPEDDLSLYEEEDTDVL